MNGLSYFVFSSQEHIPLKDLQNLVILNSEAIVSAETEFSLCSSIYIGYFRGYQTFFTIGSEDTLWLSLSFQGQDVTSGYNVVLSFFGGTLFNNAHRIKVF